jgi:hypothetical protein
MSGAAATRGRERRLAACLDRCAALRERFGRGPMIKARASLFAACVGIGLATATRQGRQKPQGSARMRLFPPVMAIHVTF